jgi:hypothetical protein
LSHSSTYYMLNYNLSMLPVDYDSSMVHVELRLKYITCWTTTQVYYMLNYDSSILHVKLRLKYITCWTTTQVYYMLNYDSSILHVELRLKYITCWTTTQVYMLNRYGTSADTTHHSHKAFDYELIFSLQPIRPCIHKTFQYEFCTPCTPKLEKSERHI